MAAINIGWPLLFYIDDKWSCQRFRFHVWLQIRRCMSPLFWRTVCMEDELDSADIAKYLNEVRSNTEICAALPLFLIDSDGSRIKVNAGVASSFKSKSTTQTTKQLKSMGVLDHDSEDTPLLFPRDPQLPARHAVGDNQEIVHIVVDWDASWLPYVQPDEVRL